MNSSLLNSPLERTLPLQVADRIGALIVEEHLGPGRRLIEVSLAEDFQVSRATVREALRILEQRKLVCIVPQRGAQVTKLTRQELEDLFEIRAALLGLVSRRVALEQSARGKEVLSAGLKKLRAARDDGSAYARASAEMVAELTDLCGNRQLSSYIADFALRIGRYARLGLTTRERRQQSLRDWKALQQAIGAGDGDQAEKLHRRLSRQNQEAAVKELGHREDSVDGNRPGIARS